jgi:hypothetical protein
MAALLSTGAALLCASAPSLCRFVLPLATLGLLLGVAGLALVLSQGRTRLLFPSAGTGFAGGVLFTALLFPGLLGPVFLASRAGDALDARVIRTVPLPGKLGTIGAAGRESVDASGAALQLGKINLRVVSASIRRVTSKSSFTKKIPPGDYHFIRLRMQQVDAAKGSAAGSGLEKSVPSLKNNSGETYRLSDVQEVGPAPGPRKSSGFPVAFQDQVLVFEAPANLEDLYLEVPAEQWGGKGTFRFTIPRSMIQDERAAPSGVAGRR